MGIPQGFFEQPAFRISAQRCRPLDAVAKPRARFRRADHGAHRNALGIHRQFVILLVVSDTLRADLGGRVFNFHRNYRGRLDFLRGALPQTSGSVGEEPVDHRDQSALLLVRFGDEVGRAKGHHGAVVRGVIEPASCQHETVEMRHRETYPLIAGLVLQHPAGAAAMPVERRPLSPEKRRRAIGLAVDDVRHVAQHRGVEQPVNGVVVIEAAIMAALDPISGRQRIRFGGFACGHSISSRDL